MTSRRLQNLLLRIAWSISIFTMAVMLAGSTWSKTAAVQPSSLLGLGLSLVFAVIAKMLRAVTWGGALTGAACAWVIFTRGGPPAFAALASLFVLTFANTRFGYAKKRALRATEGRGGRTASQVLANISVAAGCLALSLRFPVFAFAGIAALCEAAADTVASELGKALSAHAFLITSFEKVKAGADGGVTAAGCILGLLASVTVAFSYFACLYLPWPYQQWMYSGRSSRMLLLATLAGYAGMLLDSLMGATLERRGWLNNDGVNFLGTLAAAILMLVWGTPMPVVAALQRQ